MPLRTRVVIGASMQYQYDVFGRLYVLSYVTDEQQKKVPKKSDLVLSVMKESLQAGCAGPPWLCARLLSVEGYWEATSSRARTPGALGCGCMIGQPAADNHYTTTLSRQARKPVVHPPWNGYIYSNEKRRFSLHTFFCRPTKESMKKYNVVDNPTGDDILI